MGSLTLPAGGMVYLDANAVIYSAERVPPYHATLAPLWHNAGSGGYSLVKSELSLLEVLVGPIRASDSLLEATYRSLLFSSSDFGMAPISVSVLEQAAAIRASAGLKTPDAIHAATALSLGCTQFITNDPVFKRVAALPVVVLSDVLAT